jgi:hypothetical protein
MRGTDDREVAKAWLEHLQADAYAHFGELPDREESPSKIPKVLAHMRSVFDTLAVDGRVTVDGKAIGFDEYVKYYDADLEAARRACPTRFESPSWYGVLVSLMEAIDRAAQKMGVHIAHPPLFGTLHTGRVNGMSVAVPDSSVRLVLIDQGLFGFANLMAKAIASSFPFTGEDGGRMTFSTRPDDVVRSIVERPEITARFLDALTAYVVRGHPQMAEPYAIPHAMRLADPLRHSMELFVVGHELAHVALGHLDGNAVPRAVADTVQADEVETSWQQEVAADSLAVMMTIHAMLDDGHDLSMSFWGADLFFGCIDVVERAVYLLTNGVDPGQQTSKTHPPAAMRRELIRATLISAVDDPDVAKGPLKLARIVELALGGVWQRSVPVLARMHADGIRPKRWWTEELAREEASG